MDLWERGVRDAASLNKLIRSTPQRAFTFGIALAFMLVYRLAEAQALKLVQPFLLDRRDVGGLGLEGDEGLEEDRREGVVKAWRMGEPFFLDILGFYTDGEYGDFTNPKTGYDFSFTRTGQGMATRYNNLRASKAKPLLIDDWKSKLRQLDRFVKPYTRKQIREILAGQEPE